MVADLWQHILVAIVILSAIGWLVYRYRQHRKVATACDSCAAMKAVRRRASGDDLGS